MKILTFEEFSKCKEGVIFSFLDEGYGFVRGLCRKGPTIYGSYDGPNKPIDFFYTELLPQVEVYATGWKDEAPPYNPLLERWGEFDYSVRYVIFEESDLETLRDTLTGPIHDNPY